MSDTHTITDEELLAAWGGADGMDAERRAETAADLRVRVGHAKGLFGEGTR